jgi:[ribosomal protein S5]-alanine N-acetyltransferase
MSLPLCRTERLVIRPFVLEDAPFILRLLNEPTFIEHIADRGVRTLADAEGYLRDGPIASQARHGHALWHVRLAATDTPIGMAGLLKRDTMDRPDLGYALLPDFVGQGMAREATEAVMAYAQATLHLTHIAAIVNPGNTRSIRLLDQLGFVLEAPMPWTGGVTVLCYGWTAAS